MQHNILIQQDIHVQMHTYIHLGTNFRLLDIVWMLQLATHTSTCNLSRIFGILDSYTYFILHGYTYRRFQKPKNGIINMKHAFFFLSSRREQQNKILYLPLLYISSVSEGTKRRGGQWEKPKAMYEPLAHVGRSLQYIHTHKYINSMNHTYIRIHSRMFQSYKVW